MTTFIVITTLISLLMSAGISVSNLYTQVKNQELRSMIQGVASKVTSQLKNGRLKVGKLLSLLTNQNSAALQQYLYSNPLVSKSFGEIQDDSNAIAALQSEASHLENLISQYQSELSSLGYSSSQQGLAGERSRYAATTAKLDDAVRKYDDLSKKIEDTKVSPYRDFKVDTSHLDAVSQNIIGGMK